MTKQILKGVIGDFVGDTYPQVKHFALLNEIDKKINELMFFASKKENEGCSMDGNQQAKGVIVNA